MTTVFDVAKAAGCSISTVSRVVNGLDAVTPETRARVRKAIEETGYRRHGPARALKRHETESIGLVVGNVADIAVAELIQGVACQADELDLALLLKICDGGGQRIRQAVQSLLERRVDGVLLTGLRESPPESANLAIDRRTPMIVVDYPFVRWRDLVVDEGHTTFPLHSVAPDVLSDSIGAPHTTAVEVGKSAVLGLARRIATSHGQPDLVPSVDSQALCANEG